MRRLGAGDSCNVEASRGHPGGPCGHICLTVTAIPGVSCGPSMHSQATQPWHSERAGGRGQGGCSLPILLWTGLTGQSLGWNQGPTLWGIGGQTGSHWFGQITSSKRNHSPHICFPLLDHTKCFQTWGPGDEPWAGSNIPKEKLFLFPAV